MAEELQKLMSQIERDRQEMQRCIDNDFCRYGKVQQEFYQNLEGLEQELVQDRELMSHDVERQLDELRQDVEVSDKSFRQFSANIKDDVQNFHTEIEAERQAILTAVEMNREGTSKEHDYNEQFHQDVVELTDRMDQHQQTIFDEFNSAETAAVDGNAFHEELAGRKMKEFEDIKNEFHRRREMFKHHLEKQQKQRIDRERVIRRHRLQLERKAKRWHQLLQRRIQYRFETFLSRNEGNDEPPGSPSCPEGLKDLLARTAIQSMFGAEEPKGIIQPLAGDLIVTEADGVRKLKLEFTVDYRPEEVSVDIVDGNLLQISGNQDDESAERPHVFCSLVYRLPDGLDLSQFTATVGEDGVLTVDIPAPSTSPESRVQLVEGEIRGQTEQSAMRLQVSVSQP